MNLEEIDNLKRLLKSQEIEDIELLFDILDTNKRIKARILRKFSKFYNKGRKYKIRPKVPISTPFYLMVI